MVPRVLLASTALIGIALAVLEALVEAAAMAVMEDSAERAVLGLLAAGRAAFRGRPLTARSVVSAASVGRGLMQALWPTAVKAATVAMVAMAGLAGLAGMGESEGVLRRPER
jgi:hypothetical protein